MINLISMARCAEIKRYPWIQLGRHGAYSSKKLECLQSISVLCVLIDHARSRTLELYNKFAVSRAMELRSIFVTQQVFEFAHIRWFLVPFSTVHPAVQEAGVLLTLTSPVPSCTLESLPSSQPEAANRNPSALHSQQHRNSQQFQDFSIIDYTCHGHESIDVQNRTTMLIPTACEVLRLKVILEQQETARRHSTPRGFSVREYAEPHWEPVIGEISGHTRLRSECLQVEPVACSHPPVFVYWIGVYSIHSSKMIGKFPAVDLNLNRLFLKLNRFICNKPPVLPDHSWENPWTSAFCDVQGNLCTWHRVVYRLERFTCAAVVVVHDN